MLPKNSSLPCQKVQSAALLLNAAITEKSMQEKELAFRLSKLNRINTELECLTGHLEY